MFKKTLIIILVSVLLSAVITVAAFQYTGIAAYAKIKLDELSGPAKFLASKTGEYMQGQIGDEEFKLMFSVDRRLWDAEPYIYNTDADLIAWSAKGDFDSNTSLIAGNVGTVLAGGEISTYTFKNGAGLIVGNPVYDDSDTVIGAVFLVKPINELNSTLSMLVAALAFATLISGVIMVLPAYLLSKRLTRPIKQMNTVALSMADGNFSVRAHTEGRDEVAQLGRSLNELSGALGDTISSLSFERNRLRSILDGLGEGVIAVNRSGEMMQFNPAAAGLLGCGSTAIVETEIYRSIEAAVNDVLGGSDVRVEERKHGESELRLTVTGLAGGNGIEGALILVQDVTESVRLEQTRRDYVANVSQELRTPLASIRSLADALADGLITKTADRARYYGYIQKESMRLSRLIDDLLELSRLQSGAVALTKQRMSVDELLMDVADRFGGIAKERGFEIKTNVEEDCPQVYSNPDRTEQVLVALLDNAVKHNESCGTIAIAAERKGEKLEISVVNDGAIDERDITHLFERFYKADKAHSGEGTGLGLAISKEIMDLLGERIWAASGNGKVTFTFTLDVYGNANEEKR